MVKTLLLLLSFCGLAFAQSPVYNNFSSTVKGVTVGSYHCYFWFHGSSPAPWDAEVACYGTANQKIEVSLPNQTVVDNWPFPLGNIGWQFIPSGSVINVIFSYMDTNGTVQLVQTATI